MSDIIEWNIDECIQVIEGLNQNGTLIKNAIAGIYNTFRYRISEVWSGHNYNVVVRELNGCAPEFRSMTEYLGVTIPTVMQEIVNAQAADGQGYAQTIALGSSNENPDIWEVQESVETADGSTNINVDAVMPYVTGAEYPSVTAAADLAKQYFQNYLNIFEQNLSIFQNNQAIVDAYNQVQEYKTQFETRTQELIDIIVYAVNEGIEKIEEGNIETIKAAQSVVDGSDGEALGSNASHYNPDTGVGINNTNPHVQNNNNNTSGAGNGNSSDVSASFIDSSILSDVGDSNGDGKTNIADFVASQQQENGNVRFKDIPYDKVDWDKTRNELDVNNDGIVTEEDREQYAVDSFKNDTDPEEIQEWKDKYDRYNDTDY